MESRLLDFLYAVLLVAIAFSGTGLMVYAIWTIGQRLMKAVHTVLTCWEYHNERADNELWLNDSVMRGIVTMQSSFRRAYLPFSPFAADLKRLDDYRSRKATEQAKSMIWDKRLGGLITRDEHEFLYGMSPTRQLCERQKPDSS